MCVEVSETLKTTMTCVKCVEREDSLYMWFKKKQSLFLSNMTVRKPKKSFLLSLSLSAAVVCGGVW